jgi:AcrR family transcriptional regulator
MHPPVSPDRRVERTRGSLLDAFAGLILSRTYERIAVGDIVDRANVGRSTFYEHFESKDDLLRTSIAGPLAVLADAAAGAAPERMEMLVAHFGENREMTRRLLGGAGRHVVSKVLAELLEARLRAARRPESSKPLLPLPFVARSIAGGQLAILETWLEDVRACSNSAVARALSASSRAAASALLGRS